MEKKDTKAHSVCGNCNLSREETRRTDRFVYFFCPECSRGWMLTLKSAEGGVAA